MGILAMPSCSGPVSYSDRSKVEADIANLKDNAGGSEVFMTAASPGIIAGYMPNRYYATTEEYIFALADAMKEEYDAIYEAGVVLQLDCPDLPGAAGDEDVDLDDFRGRCGDAPRGSGPRHSRHPVRRGCVCICAGKW